MFSSSNSRSDMVWLYTNGVGEIIWGIIYINALSNGIFDAITKRKSLYSLLCYIYIYTRDELEYEFKKFYYTNFFPSLPLSLFYKGEKKQYDLRNKIPFSGIFFLSSFYFNKHCILYMYITQNVLSLLLNFNFCNFIIKKFLPI